MVFRPVIPFQGRRNTHRPAGVGPDPTTAPSRAATATPVPRRRTARRAMCARVPRVPRRAEVLVGAPARQRQNSTVWVLPRLIIPAAMSLRCRVAGVRRDPVAPCGGASHGDLALDLHEVLDRDRNAVQRADLRGPRADGFVRRLGGQPGIRGIDRHESLEFGLQPVDPRQIFVDQIDRGEAAGSDLGRQRVDRGGKLGRA